MQGRGPRDSGTMAIHVVTATCTTLLLQSLLNDRLLPLCSAEDTEIQVGTTHWAGKVQQRLSVTERGNCWFSSTADVYKSMDIK